MTPLPTPHTCRKHQSKTFCITQVGSELQDGQEVTSCIVPLWRNARWWPQQWDGYSHESDRAVSGLPIFFLFTQVKKKQMSLTIRKGNKCFLYVPLLRPQQIFPTHKNSQLYWSSRSRVEFLIIQPVRRPCCCGQGHTSPGRAGLSTVLVTKTFTLCST